MEPSEGRGAASCGGKSTSLQRPIMPLMLHSNWFFSWEMAISGGSSPGTVGFPGRLLG
jgi:hypothetical protein